MVDPRFSNIPQPTQLSSAEILARRYYPLRASILKFWAGAKYPSDTVNGHVLLARAVMIAGVGLFPDEWHNTDPEDFFSETFFSPAPLKTPPSSATLAEQADWQAREAPVRRFLKTREWIIEEFRSGRIKTGVFDRRDDTIRLLVPQRWERERVQVIALFQDCRWWDSLTPSPRSQNSMQIFVNDQDLTTALAALAPASASLNTDDAGFTKTQKKEAAEQVCEEWLRELAGKHHKAPKLQEDYKIEALEKFPHLSGNGFYRAWSLAVPRSWAVTGPKGPRKDS